MALLAELFAFPISLAQNSQGFGFLAVIGYPELRLCKWERVSKPRPCGACTIFISYRAYDPA